MTSDEFKVLEDQLWQTADTLRANSDLKSSEYATPVLGMIFLIVAMVTSAQNKFSDLKGCSFDKGFYTPGNKKDLKNTLNILVLPKKGRRNKAECEEETAEDFIRLKR